MNKILIKVTAVAVALMMSGCLAWKPVDSKPVTSSGGKYSLNLPVGWNVLALGTQQIASKYGTGLQSLTVRQINLKNAFGTGKNRTNASADMDPRELCEKLVADMKALPNNETLEITSVQPYMLGGRPGFRAELKSKRTFQADGIRYQHVLYGTANKNGVYTLQYEAPVLHYFAKDLPDVEAAAGTFKLL
jgi:hypothetical protein